VANKISASFAEHTLDQTKTDQTHSYRSRKCWFDLFDHMQDSCLHL